MADDYINKTKLRTAFRNIRGIGNFGSIISNMGSRITRLNKVTIINTRAVFFNFMDLRWSGDWNDETQVFADTINSHISPLFNQHLITKEAYAEYKIDPKRKEYTDAPLLEYTTIDEHGGESKKKSVSSSVPDPELMALVREARATRAREEAVAVQAPRMMRQTSLSQHPDADTAELFTGIFGENELRTPSNNEELYNMVHEYRENPNITEVQAFQNAAKKAKKYRYLKEGRVMAGGNMRFSRLLNNSKLQRLQKIRNFKPFNSELKSIVFELFSKINGTTKDLIVENSKNPNDLFNNFNIMRNRDKLSFAAFLLNKSYQIMEKESNVGPVMKKALPGLAKSNNAVRFSEFANSIYLKEQVFRQFSTKKGCHIHLYQGKQQKSRALVPKYSLLVDNLTKSILLVIKGTSTLIDAVIDGLATTESVLLDGKKYLVHSGFLRAGREIVKQITPKLTELISTTGYNIVVTGHSLGGGVSTVAGVLIYDKFAKNKRMHVDVFGYASGTTFGAEPNNVKPLEKYLNIHANLKINTFVYKEDVVPRLSLFDGFALIAICTSICKLIFLNQEVNIFPNFLIDRQVIEGMYKELNLHKLLKASQITKKFNTQFSKKATGMLNNVKRFSPRRKSGGAPKENTLKVLLKIQEIVKICIPYFEMKLKQNNKYYKTKTTHPGKVFLLHDINPIKNINPYKLSFLNFQMSSVKNHSMNNYITTLKKFLPDIQVGGHHLYKRLRVSKYASGKHIRKTFKKIKKKGKVTRKIRHAYKVLSNKKSRKKYNKRYKKRRKTRRKRRA